MTKWFLGTAVLAAVLSLSVPAQAEIILASDWSGSEDVAAQMVDKPVDVGGDYDKPVGAYQTGDKDCYDDCGKGGKGYGYAGCCGRGSAFFDIEFQFMRYFQEGGVTDVIGSPAQFDYDFTPKIEAGFVGPGGLGVRGRIWYYDGATLSAALDVVGVEAYYVDLEMFQQYDLACHSTLEVSLGLRYSDFTQELTNFAAPGVLLSGWQGWGGTIGVEAKRQLCVGSLYARGRFSVLMGDSSVVTVLPAITIPFYAEGNTVTQTELAVGYEVSRCFRRAVVNARIGAEWQNWSNMAMADTSFGGIGSRDILEDAGWAGVVFTLGIAI